MEFHLQTPTNDRLQISNLSTYHHFLLGNMMRTLLNMMNESDPWGGVSVHLHQIDLTNRIEKAEPGSAVGSDERLKKFGDQYLKVLDDDRTRFLDRVGDAGGGQYVINVKVWSLNKWLV